MYSVFKYPLEITDFQKVQMPKGAQIHSAQMQCGRLCIWAEIDTEAPPVERRFEVFGTGNPIDYDMAVTRQFIATVQDGQFVWHLYERTGI